MGESQTTHEDVAISKQQQGVSEVEESENHDLIATEDQSNMDSELNMTLLIVPPSPLDVTDTIRLEAVSSADTVLSLRQLLAEYPVLACYTCYHLEVESSDDNGSKTWLPLNDYVELGEYADVIDGATLRMVLDKYDARKVRAHVRRLRDVLLNPPIPQHTGAEVVEEETLSGGESSNNKKKKKNQTDSSVDEKTQKELAEQQLQRLRKIHESLEGVKIPVVADLGEFYSMALTTSTRNPTIDNDMSATQGKKGKSGSKNKGKKKGPPVQKDEEEQDTVEINSLETAKLPQCVKSMVFSGYNPPPGPRKLAGDLCYLEVKTEDNVLHHITAHVNGFFVNRSTINTFDPRPTKNSQPEHLLSAVLMTTSEKFKQSYTQLLQRAAVLAAQGPVSIEWMVAAGNQIGCKLPWNTPTTPMTTKHEYDLNRAEDDLCLSFGMDERGVLRDWNEEYQCCRELPAKTLKEQVIRARVMYKIVTEFVEAATQGAVAIVEGHIPPINPMDDASAHVYVFNNIFFSLSVDGKSTATTKEGEEASYSSANRDLQGVKAFNEADVQGLHTLATTVVDYLGVRVIAQSVIPGILQGEAASKLIYGSVDGGKTIASNAKMHELMLKAGAKLHIAERSIKPLGRNSLETDVTEEEDGVLVAGENNGGEAGTDVVNLVGPVEAKGILGSDGRMYVLDLVRTTPKDATFYATHNVKCQETVATESTQNVLRFERNDEGYVALLRPELVQLYSLWKQNQLRKAARKTPETPEGSEDAHMENVKAEDVEDKFVPPIQLNANVFQKYAASTNPEEAEADEVAARDAADYLQKIVIPAFVADIRRGSISPADGHALTALMHSCGINMRYLGRLAALSKKLEAFGGISKYILELLEIEMIARAVKHIVADVLNSNETIRAAPGDALVQLLNAIFAGWIVETPETEKADKSGLSDRNPNKKSGKKNKKKTVTERVNGNDHSSDNTYMDGPSVWNRITTLVKERYSYALSLWTPYQGLPSAQEEESQNSKFQRIYKNVLLRRVCQRLGLRVASKAYDFSSTNAFQLDDLTGVVPLVKHSLPAHPLSYAKQLLERGRMNLSNGSLATAYELLQETSSLLFQVVGGAHEDAALCCTSLASVLYQAGDVAGAIAQQQRALALYTQIEGLDYHDTAFAYANLALFLHSNSQTDLAVVHMRRAIYLLELCAGPHFPEVSTLYLRMGSMCQDVGQVTLALICYRESLHRGEFDRLQAANTLHQMALACSMAGGYRDALVYEKRVYTLLKDAFGEKDPRVVESSKFMAKFTERAVEGAKGRREVDAVAHADAVAQELLAEFALKEDTTKKTGKAGSASRKQHH